MLIPVVFFFIVFAYVPMYGITLAWKDYRPKFGISGSSWVGWDNFRLLFEQPYLIRAIKNTLVISLLKLVFCFPAPIFLALLLNELRMQITRKSIQTMLYLPNFISWVILGSLVKMFLALDDGVVNLMIQALGGEKVAFMLQPQSFYPILIIAELWKGVGWGTIIYTASIAGIDQTLYEAAKIDGCRRGGLMFRITIPCILPIITVMLIIQLSNIMNAGFDSVYNLYNKTIYNTADIIDTYIYRLFIDDHEMSLSSAVGIFKTSINFILLLGGNMLTKKINGYSMFSID